MIHYYHENKELGIFYSIPFFVWIELNLAISIFVFGHIKKCNGGMIIYFYLNVW